LAIAGTDDKRRTLARRGELMAKKRDQASSSGKMSLDQRLANYLAGGRRQLTPRQARRAAHKAHLSTDQVREQGAKP
jgi:hypothetical protein